MIDPQHSLCRHCNGSKGFHLSLTNMVSNGITGSIFCVTFYVLSTLSQCFVLMAFPVKTIRPRIWSENGTRGKKQPIFHTVSLVRVQPHEARGCTIWPEKGWITTHALEQSYIAWDVKTVRYVQDCIFLIKKHNPDSAQNVIRAQKSTGAYDVLFKEQRLPRNTLPIAYVLKPIRASLEKSVWGSAVRLLF